MPPQDIFLFFNIPVLSRLAVLSYDNSSTGVLDILYSKRVFLYFSTRNDLTGTGTYYRGFW
jgi:hypothetical protein